MRPESISLHGLDGTGKQTLSVQIALALSSINGLPTLYTGYPHYWGTGRTVKLLNTRGGQKLVWDLAGGNLELAIHLRTSVYALDRLVSLPLFRVRKQKHGKVNIVSDRGAACNAVSIAYTLAKVDRDVSGLAEHAMDCIYELETPFEREFSDQARRTSNLILAEEKGKVANGLEGKVLDILEQSQDRIAETATNLYQRVIKTDPIFTRDANGWRSSQEVGLQLLIQNGVDAHINHFPSAQNQQANTRKSSFIHIGPTEFATAYFGGSLIEPSREITQLHMEMQELTTPHPTTINPGRNLGNELSGMELESSDFLDKLMFNAPDLSTLKPEEFNQLSAMVDLCQGKLPNLIMQLAQLGDYPGLQFFYASLFNFLREN